MWANPWRSSAPGSCFLHTPRPYNPPSTSHTRIPGPSAWSGWLTWEQITRRLRRNSSRNMEREKITCAYLALAMTRMSLNRKRCLSWVCIPAFNWACPWRRNDLSESVRKDWTNGQVSGHTGIRKLSLEQKQTSPWVSFFSSKHFGFRDFFHSQIHWRSLKKHFGVFCGGKSRTVNQKQLMTEST